MKYYCEVCATEHESIEYEMIDGVKLNVVPCPAMEKNKIKMRRTRDIAACVNCRFYKPLNTSSTDIFNTRQRKGICRRYPEHMMKDDTEWCGEWVNWSKSLSE